MKGGYSGLNVRVVILKGWYSETRIMGLGGPFIRSNEIFAIIVVAVKQYLVKWRVFRGIWLR